MGEPDTVSTGLAPFVDDTRPQDGHPRSFVPSLTLCAQVRIPLSLPVTVAPLVGTGFSSVTPAGIDDVSTTTPRRAAAECRFDQVVSAPLSLPQAHLGRAIPAASETPAAIAPDSRTDALETSPANTWLAPCPPLKAPTELPPVRGVSTLREHPLAGPISVSYSIAYRSSRSASFAEASLGHDQFTAPNLPELLLSAIPAAQMTEPAEPPARIETFTEMPAAVPAARWIEPASADALPAHAALFVPRGPRLSPVTYPAATNGTMPVPLAEALENPVQPKAALAFASAPAVSLLPQIQGLEVSRILEPLAGSEWMDSAPSQPAARHVLPADAATQAFAARPIQLLAMRIPLAETGQSVEPAAPVSESFPIAAPVAVEAAPTARAYSPAAISPASVRLAAFAMEAARTAAAAPLTEFFDGLAPMPAEAVATAPAHPPIAITAKPAIALPRFELQPELQPSSWGNAGFERQVPTAVAPPKRVANRAAAVEPLHAIEPLTPPFQPAATMPSIPGGNAMPLASRIQQAQGKPVHNPQWINPTLDSLLPRFGLRPVLERYEVADLRSESKRTGVFDIGEYTQFRKHKPALRHAGTAIAACLLVAVGLWFGSYSANLGRRIVSRDATAEIAAIQNTARAASPAGHSGSSHWISPVVWAKTSIAKRAAVQLTDSFAQGMQAWGAAAKSWAPGWSHSEDGFVRPGQLALLQPTLSYTDYRLEFFGQIEKKGMSWAVRARDPKNYYGMKVKVVEPGLRPVVSMVHYAVVAGKIARSVETPLSVMMHNDTPYHVAVQVRGRQYTASIEGQEVDSWTDDVLPSGGVGFFAEAGEKARLYWMKVDKNDDWLGRVCAYLSGSSVEESRETAWLERPQAPAPAPSRREPAPSEVVLIAGETGEYSSGRPHRSATRAASQGRIQTWGS